MGVLRRFDANPVLAPRPGAWDSVSVFNPGADRVVGLATADMDELLDHLAS